MITIARAYWKIGLAAVLVAALLLGLWAFSERVYERFGAAEQVTTSLNEMSGAGPIIDGPGHDSFAFRDSTGESELVQAENVDFESELGVEINQPEKSDVQLIVGVQRVWFPDLTGQSAIVLRGVGGRTDAVTTTPQKPALISFSSQLSVGPSLSQVDRHLSPGLMVNYSPIRVWALRIGVFASVSRGENTFLFDAGPSVSTRLTRTVRPVVGWGAIGSGPMIGVAVDL